MYFKKKGMMKNLYFMILLSVMMYADVVSIDNNETKNIEDNKCVDLYFDVEDDMLLTDVRLDVNLTHTYRADLDVVLKSPQDTSVSLTSDNGGSSDNLYVAFDDAKSISIADDNEDHLAGLEPRKPEEQLSAFADENASGRWTLSICDDAYQDVGEYKNATLYLDNTPPPPVDEGVEVNFQMDECYWLGGANGVEDDVLDSSANQLHAQSRNNADNTATNAVVCRAGDLNNTYEDADESDAVFYPNETEAELAIGADNTFTVSAWLYRHDDEKWMAAVIKSSDETWKDGWGLIHAKDSGKNIDFFVDDYAVHARTELATDTWTHIAATYDGSTIRIYKNGVLEESTSQDTYTHGEHAVMVGDDVSGSDIDDRWQGTIDEVKVWGRVLSKEDIEKIYDNEHEGKNFDGTERTCKKCNGSSINENSWDFIGVPVELRDTTVTVDDVLGDDMNGSYEDDWIVYKRTYSDTDNSSDYEALNLDDPMKFGIGYWLGSRYDNEWFVDGLEGVDYNSSHDDCANAPCVEIDLTPVTLDFETDEDDGSGPYRYNMSGFVGMDKPVDWADCRFLIDGTAYTPSDANASGYANKQIWMYNGTGTDASNSYTTCDDTMECKLVPFKGFWVELHGKTKGKSVKLLIPKE